MRKAQPYRNSQMKTISEPQNLRKSIFSCFSQMTFPNNCNKVKQII